MADGGENTEQRPALMSGREVALGDRFKIRSTQTVVDMASPAAEAFVAIDSTAPDTTCVALVARPEQLPRISSCTQIKGLDQLGVMRLYDHGSVDWPDGTRRYAMVYEAPAARRSCGATTRSNPSQPRPWSAASFGPPCRL